MIRISIAVLVGALLAPVSALAQTSPEATARMRAALRALAREPSVQDVQEAAVRHFRLEPEAIDGLRSRATSRAFLPSISVSGTVARLDVDRSVEDPLAVLDTTDQSNNDTLGATATFSWNLAGTVFDASQLQTYALVGYQVNILKEVTRLYFIRKQIVLSMMVEPPADARARAALELRIQEFTSLIDSYTGGYFSRQLHRRR